MTSMSGLPGLFSHIGVTHEGLGHQRAKKPDYNHKMISPTACFNGVRFVFSNPELQRRSYTMPLNFVSGQLFKWKNQYEKYTLIPQALRKLLPRVCYRRGKDA